LLPVVLLLLLRKLAPAGLGLSRCPLLPRLLLRLLLSQQHQLLFGLRLVQCQSS
jgi:hypothetical protein